MSSFQHGKFYDVILKHNKKLSNIVHQVLTNGRMMPVVLGGDHSGAIGTWSGVAKSLAASSKRDQLQLELQPKLGLVWVDAHMDSHTVTSSPSKVGKF